MFVVGYIVQVCHYLSVKLYIPEGVKFVEIVIFLVQFSLLAKLKADVCKSRLSSLISTMYI